VRQDSEASCHGPSSHTRPMRLQCGFDQFDVPMLNEIPTQRPETPLLDTLDSPAQLRELKEKQLPQLAEELRAFLLYCVGQTGGHFGAGLGVVELTVALHYVYQTPEDKLVWDVGHQTYPHKILT